MQHAVHVMPSGKISKSNESGVRLWYIPFHSAWDDRSTRQTRKDYMLIKIKFEDLLWFRSELNYLELLPKASAPLRILTSRAFSVAAGNCNIPFRCRAAAENGGGKCSLPKERM